MDQALRSKWGARKMARREKHSLTIEKLLTAFQVCVTHGVSCKDISSRVHLINGVKQAEQVSVFVLQACPLYYQYHLHAEFTSVFIDVCNKCRMRALRFHARRR